MRTAGAAMSCQTPSPIPGRLGIGGTTPFITDFQSKMGSFFFSFHRLLSELELLSVAIMCVSDQVVVFHFSFILGNCPILFFKKTSYVFSIPYFFRTSHIVPPTSTDSFGDDNGLAGARRLYLQRGLNGYGFLFSTNGGSGQGRSGSMNHFVSRVDEGSQAAVCGLQVGDRLLKVNDVNISNMVHQSVVSLIQENPTGVPLRLLVCAPARLTPTTLRANGVDSVSSTLSVYSEDGRKPSSAEAVRTVVVVVRNPDNGALLAVKLSHVCIDLQCV